MEREPAPLYSSTSAVHVARAPRVLKVNVLYGMTGDEAAAGGGGNSTGPLGTSAAVYSALNLSRAASLSHSYGAHVGASATRRSMIEAANPNSSALSLTAMNGSGAATATSSLAKPVLDPSQVRCCPLDQWIPDAHVMNCMAPDCNNNFSLFNRKHRCRMCGRVFCASCCNNLVCLSAATAAKAMPTGMQEGLSVNNNNNTASSSHHTFYGTKSGNSPASTPELTALGGGSDAATPSGPTRAAVSANGVHGANGAGMRSNSGDSSVGSTSPGAETLTTTSQVGMDSTSGSANTSMGNATSNANSSNIVTNSVVSSPVVANVVPCRVCASCSYEVQLVVSTRQENGELRRRSRGELKMLQRVLLVKVMTYLNLLDLASMAMVSADFYFMSRDNLIWYQYNMTRWVQEGEAMQLSSLKSRAAALRAQQQRASPWYGGGGGNAPSSLADDIFNSTPVIQDATALSESEAAKRVISLHARYNYTQFLDFARRQEMARCEGLSSFSLGARILLSSPIRVALVGPSGIGKTAAVQSFLGEKAAQMVVRPTIGFVRRATAVRLAGGLSAEVTLHIYDLSGADRYEELRRFVCRHCHAIALCYDPAHKVTLVQAADIMMELEPVLGPQPVVVCGLLRKGPSHPSKGPMETAYGRGEGPPSRAAGMHESDTARKTLALEAYNAQSTPVNSGAAADVAPATTNPTTGASSTFAGIDSCTVGQSLSMTMGNDNGRGAGGGGGHLLVSSPPLTPSPPPAPVTTPTAGGSEVSIDDAVGITVRGLSSIQCPMLRPAPLFEALVQAVLDRLGEATVANTTTISEISAELTMQNESSLSATAASRLPSSTNPRSISDSVRRSSVRRRRPAASRTIVQDLLNLTMQPCALDILLDRK
ncbi:hypothetical protein ABB37_07212 [Leptomonas pyrrhocoris]|uniref:FYVE-type domain-containing protein n=1 Tax=Leptomonas pyrrhocoris TaxID=157538 RepID=A0A0M9FWE3_LEPPY|nr:hypothetical protein ABB37_07212 [Leptomonas pyrrhocoris]KPA77327.1 hypothetical protein ABB37_07212 [Leptomonas pyrrhocoris]|eukprot:XP_015655766.1 hypothetical protein ABB37_07212 [Leptomonas pyrrhocoris]